MINGGRLTQEVEEKKEKTTTANKQTNKQTRSCPRVYLFISYCIRFRLHIFLVLLLFWRRFIVIKPDINFNVFNIHIFIVLSYVRHLHHICLFLVIFLFFCCFVFNLWSTSDLEGIFQFSVQMKCDWNEKAQLCSCETIIKCVNNRLNREKKNKHFSSFCVREKVANRRLKQESEWVLCKFSSNA